MQINFIASVEASSGMLKPGDAVEILLDFNRSNFFDKESQLELRG
jgi:hypothetical protein